MFKDINKFLQYEKFYFDDLLMRDSIYLRAVFGGLSFIFIISISLFTWHLKPSDHEDYPDLFWALIMVFVKSNIGKAFHLLVFYFFIAFPKRSIENVSN